MIQDPKTGDWTGTVTGGSVMKDYEKKNGKTKDKRSVCEARIRIMPQLFKGNLITLMSEFGPLLHRHVYSTFDCSMYLSHRGRPVATLCIYEGQNYWKT